MSFGSKIAKPLAAALVLWQLHTHIAWAHIPIPPKKPSEIGRHVVNRPVTDFSLTDQNGHRFQFSRLRGKIVLVTFIFTTCPDVCPLLTGKFAALQRTLDRKNPNDYWLISITTDPEQDSPTALKDYAARFEANAARWAFLTGSRADVAKVWKVFGVNVTKTESGQIFHTALTTLLDRRGNRRVDYYGDKWLEKEVLKDIQWLSSQR